MFQRRQILTLSEKLMNFIWPRSGWYRSTRYVFYRMARMPGTAYSVAAGFACGAAASFTPFVGFHFILAVMFALLLRANVVASLFGTAVGNPWTFPLIWVWLYGLGRKMGAGPDVGGRVEPEFSEVFAHMMQATLEFNLHYLAETAWPVVWPMMAGGFVMVPVVWAVTYLALQPLVYRFKMRRKERQDAKRAEREQTGAAETQEG